MCILPLGENGLKKYRQSRKWEQFKIVLLFMDHPVSDNNTNNVTFVGRMGFERPFTIIRRPS